LRVAGKRATPGDRLEAGQEIRVPPVEPGAAKPPRRQVRRDPLTAEEEQYVQDMVIYQDEHAFVLNKPPGLATQGGTKTTQHLDRLLDGIGDECGRPKLVHRLDKDTSGALLVARTARAAAHFAKAFSGRTAKKIYWAIVVGVPDANEGEIDAPLAKQPGTGGEKMHISEEHGLPAKTRWRVIDRAGNRAAWVELQPLTGRTHQLRAHMAAIGHPIVGDGKYGGPDAFLTGGISRKLHLHARRIRVDTLEGGKIDQTADLSPHFAESLDMLGFDLNNGDAAPARPTRAPGASQRKAAAAAKTRRRERRGERRARGSTAKPKRR
jgi:23S rRNA pseudouridine955/2504/2580 synthase